MSDWWRRLIGRPRSRRRMVIGTTAGFGAGFGLTLIISVVVLSASGVGAMQLSTPRHTVADPAAVAPAVDPNAGLSESQDRSNPGATTDPTPTTVPPTTVEPTTVAPTTVAPTTLAPTTEPTTVAPVTTRPTVRSTTKPPTTAPAPTTTSDPPEPTWTRPPGHHRPPRR